MKTERLSPAQLLQNNSTKLKKNVHQDSNIFQENPESEKIHPKEISKPKEEKRELGDYQIEAIRKLLDEAIEWRDLRYYRNEHDGIMYVDVVNRETGEVIRTIPEPDIQRELSKGHYGPGTHINIDG